MAGLLSDIGNTIFGDAETKDEFGQTERDRRVPIWAGLIKGGLLAYAGGGNLMPEDRAKYYAEAGGAYAGIPNDMIQAASANAQQRLRAQQLGEGQRKAGDRERIRAWAQTPQFQEMIKDAKGPDRLAIQLAIESGDMGALNTAIGNLDKSGLNAEKLQVAKDRLELAKEKAQRGGDYSGNSEVAQHLNALKNAPIDSYQYYMAHQYFSVEQKKPDGTTVGKVDLRPFPAPTYVDPRTGQPPSPAAPAPAPGDGSGGGGAGGGGAGGGGGGGGAPAPTPPEVPPGTPMTPEIVQRIGGSLKPDEEREVNGVTISKDRAGNVSWDTGTERYKFGPKGVETMPPLKPPTPGEMNTFKNITAINKIEEALKDIEGHPDIILGGPAAVGDTILQRADPNGNRARAHISDLGSVIIHDRSGAAVSPSEMARLNFIPRVTDSPPEIKRKLEAMKQFLDQETRAVYETVSRDTKLPGIVKQRYGKGGGDKPKVWNPNTGRLD